MIIGILPAAIVSLTLSAGTRETEVVSLQVDRGKYSLLATNATVGEILSRFSKVVELPVALDSKLSEKRVSVRLSSRPAERFFIALARGIGARYQINHILERNRVESGSAPDSAFTSQIVELRTDGRIPLEEALREIDANVKVETGLVGRISVFSPGLPLSRVLGSIAKQLNASWRTELRLDLRGPTDAESETYERGRDHFSDLARLSQKERHEEIRAHLEDIEYLPTYEQRKAIGGKASDISSLSTIYEQVPGEHREALNAKFGGILRAYRTELNRRRNPLYDPLLHALHAAESQIARAR